MRLKETKQVTLAPLDCNLNVDHVFTAFCLKRLQNVEVKLKKTVSVCILGHKIQFLVKQCSPEHSKIGKKTKLILLRFNTRSDMTLEETTLNIFMTDEEAKHLLSRMILKKLITEKNGIAIWKEFKKQQKQLGDDNENGHS